MRVSPGDLRSGLVNPTYRIPATRPPTPTPHSVITKALRLFHTEELPAANAYLDDAFAKPYWRTGGNATKARISRTSFDNYCARAAIDPRPVALGDTRASITVAGHQVAAGCDIVVLDNGGYQGRLCLWAVQPRPLTRQELALLACPIVQALGNELDDELIIGLDIWALRANTTYPISADLARGQTANLNALVQRLTT